MHLSAQIDAELAEAKSLEFSRRYMDADAYFALKSFSYYPRGFTRVQFDRDVAASDPDRLPFLPFRVSWQRRRSRRRDAASQPDGGRSALVGFVA